MRKLFGFCVLCAGLLLGESVFGVYPRIFSYEQRLQRKHIEQMRFDSEYAWRGWGLVNLGVRNNFIGLQEQVIAGLPQVGLDRSYALSNGKLLIGIDLSATGGKVAVEEGAGSADDQSANFGGYGIGGYLLWKTQTNCFLSLSAGVVQTFPKLGEETLKNIMWLLDVGVGKRFDLGGYFIDAVFYFGTGVISDTHSFLAQNRVKIDTQTTIPFNLLGGFWIGKQIGNHEVKVGISPFFDFYAKGEIYKQVGETLLIQEPDWRFDMLLSIGYDMRFLDRMHFYTYADFNTLRFELMLGAGFRVEFGDNITRPLKYPKFKLNRLKKTYLK